MSAATKKMRLHEMFDGDYDLFVGFCNRNPGYPRRYGYDTPHAMWASNPEVWVTD